MGNPLSRLSHIGRVLGSLLNQLMVTSAQPRGHGLGKKTKIDAGEAGDLLALIARHTSHNSKVNKARFFFFIYCLLEVRSVGSEDDRGSVFATYLVRGQEKERGKAGE